MDLTRLRSVAEDSWGVFTPVMAQEAGLTGRMLARLRRCGHVSLVCGRGFMIGTDPPTLQQRAAAACQTWPDATICFRTAALLLGWPVDDDGATHVLLPNGRKPFAGLATHHWSIRPTEIEDHGSWRMTDPRTTLADCLGRLPDNEAWGLLAWLWTRDLITITDIEAQICERKGLYGVVRLRTMLAAVRRGAVSPAEIALQDFLVAHGFTNWLGDQRIIVRGRIIARADILFAKERVIIEYDGAIAHPKHKEADDEARDERLRHLGYRVIRVRWERLIDEPRELAAEIRAALTAVAA